MRSKKLYRGWSTALLYLGGGLILYVLFRLFRKKEGAIPNPMGGEYKPSPLLPSKNKLSFDEIYQWLRREEGVNYTAVPDAGKMAIGLGHQIQPDESYLLTKRLTDNEVVELFEKDINKIIQDMNKVIKVPINKNQQLALISLRYNIGGSAFNNSTLLKLLNEGNYTGAALRFPEWRTSQGRVVTGLVNRRKREQELFSKPV